MRFTLEVRMTNVEGALERVLGKLRQRNFNLCALMADRSHDMTRINARITVESARPIEPALKQLAKLFDVEELKVQYAEAESNHVSSEFCLSV